MSGSGEKKGGGGRTVRNIVLLLLLLGLTFWGVSQVFLQKKAAVSYLTDTARLGRIVKTVVTTGEVASTRLVSVGAQVSGKIETLHRQAGDRVSEGDLIAEIDSTTQRNTLEAERARLKTYEAQLLSRETALRTAQAKYDRETRLKKGEATSTENLESAEQALAQARASLEETKSMIQQSRTAVSTAETNLAYTRITSPLDGTVVSVPVRQGQTVNANQTTPTIVQIADLSQMEIKMQISEGDITKVRPGQTVAYTILSEPDRRFEGLLESVDPGLTSVSDGSYSGSTDSGSAVYYYGKVRADNSDGTLRIGMTTQNTIIVSEASDVLIVPTVAVRDMGSGPGSPEGGRAGGDPSRRGGRGERPGGPGSPDGAGNPAGRGVRPEGARPEGTRPEGARPGAGRPEGGGARPSGGASAPGRTRASVLVMAEGAPVEREIVVGLSDNMNTEVVSGLEEGEEVVVAQMTETEMEQSRTASQSMGGRPRMTGGGMPRF
jgi:macrolide-specific efflux system membrane fusion protein